MDSVTPGWRLVHIGTEADDVEIDGVNVWNVPWGTSHSRITVPHPHHPNERHEMSTYRVQSSGDVVEFAAGEFSAGVWGFFVPEAAER